MSKLLIKASNAIKCSLFVINSMYSEGTQISKQNENIHKFKYHQRENAMYKINAK